MKWNKVGLLIILIAASAFGQYTTVQGTFQDPNGLVFSYGSYTITFVPAPGKPGPYTINGVPVNTGPFKGALSNGGGFVLSGQITDNSLIAPAGSQWSYTICPNSTTQCTQINLTTTGPLFDITAPVNAVILPLTVLSSLVWPSSYADACVQSVRDGLAYFNTTRFVPRIYYLGAWHDLGGGGAGCNFNFYHNGVFVGAQSAINFVDPPGAWTVAPDGTNTYMNITYSGLGGGGCSIAGLPLNSVLYTASGPNCVADLNFQYFPVSKFVDIGGSTYGGGLEIDDTAIDSFVYQGGFFNVITHKGAASQITVSDLNASVAGPEGLVISTTNEKSNGNKGQGLEVDVNINSGRVPSSQVGITTDVSCAGGGECFGIRPGISIPNPSTFGAASITRLSGSNSRSDGMTSGQYNIWDHVFQAGKIFTRDIVLQPELADTTTLFGTQGSAISSMSEVTCDSTQRGRIHYKNIGPDVFEVCENVGSGVYQWVTFGPTAQIWQGLVGVTAPISTSTVMWKFSWPNTPVQTLTIPSNCSTSSFDGTGTASTGSPTFVLKKGVSVICTGTVTTGSPNTIVWTGSGTATTFSTSADIMSLTYSGDATFTGTVVIVGSKQ